MSTARVVGLPVTSGDACQAIANPASSTTQNNPNCHSLLNSHFARRKRGQGEGEEMRWWTNALIFSVIFSVVWVGVVGAVGWFHTDVLLAGQITPAQDHAISEKYGDLAG